MKKIFIILLLSAPFANANDPSLIPAIDWKGEVAERYRFISDFDNDGDLDLLLSQPLSSFGNGGGGFELYLREQSKLKAIGTIFTSPNVVSIEHFWKQSKIWVYHRGGGNVGQLGYYKVEAGKLSEFEGIEVNPGDGGTDFSNALLAVIFESRNRLIPEISTTTDGIVQWNKTTTSRERTTP